MAHPDPLDPTWGSLFDLPRKGEYTYFRSPPIGAADSRSHPLRNAAVAIDAALLSYQRWGGDPMPESDLRAQLPGFDVRLLASGTSTGTEGYFAASEELGILALRGTDHRDARDFVTDCAILQVVEPREPSVFSSLFVPGIRVHLGFQVAIDSIWPEVEEILADYRAHHPHSEIRVTGHSLGAALATLAVSRFAGSHVSLYTFGSPRVGNEDFCRQLTAKADLGIYRFVNQDDIVTHVPPEDFGYRDPEPPMFHIDGNGEIQRRARAPMSDWRDLAEFLVAMKYTGMPLDPAGRVPDALLEHSPVRYAMRIWDCVARMGERSHEP
jgi:hypothetical protein